MDETLIAFQDAVAGEYSIQRELGRGGMGIVYLAREVQLNRLVAIKVLPRALATRDDVRTRFLREARTAAGLSHPNIVPIHRVGEAAGLPYFAMTYVEGMTLGERLRDRGPLQPTAMTRILRDVGQALAYAHLRGIVHRDIKPDNILLEEASGRALVTDFGIASVADDQEDKAQGGPVQGTAQFMSPEQLLGTAVDGRSDVYALGIVAYLAVSGVLPHDHPDAGMMMRARIFDEVVPLETICADAPASLASAIMRAVKHDPLERFSSAEAFVAALETQHSVARPVLPAPLRAWASQTVPLLPLYGLWSLANLSSAGVTFAAGRWEYGVGGLLSAAAPIVPITVFQLRKTRRAFSAGYVLDDLRLALREWRLERIEELEAEDGMRDPLWARALRVIAPAGFVASFLALALVFVLNGEGSINPDSWLNILFLVTRFGTVVGMGAVIVLTAFGAPLIPPALQPRLIGRARKWFWNSPLGEWFADKIAPPERAVAAGDFRPTEMALSMALDGLFASLPDEYREHLMELPTTVARLTRRASDLRADVDRLYTQAELGNPVDQESVALRIADAQERMGQTVTALERIRLGLLRLHGGVSDLRPLTTALDAAREIGLDVDRLIEAQSEVSGRRSGRGVDVRTPTPV